MTVTANDVAYVAALANLELTEAESEQMIRNLNSILNYVQRLNEIHTTDAAPMP